TTAFPGSSIATNYDVSWLDGATFTYWPEQGTGNGTFDYLYPGDGNANNPLGAAGGAIWSYVMAANQTLQMNTYPDTYLPGLTVANANTLFPNILFGVTTGGVWDNSETPIFPAQTGSYYELFCNVTLGSLYISKAGTYTFQVTHDDGCIVGIAGGAFLNPEGASFYYNPHGAHYTAHGIGGKPVPIAY